VEFANNQKDRSMQKAKVMLEPAEEMVLAFEVSDEALEMAAGAAREKANFTLGACSGLSVCDG
jgi:hypothetical protein